MELEFWAKQDEELLSIAESTLMTSICSSVLSQRLLVAAGVAMLLENTMRLNG